MTYAAPHRSQVYACWSSWWRISLNSTIRGPGSWLQTFLEQLRLPSGVVPGLLAGVVDELPGRGPVHRCRRRAVLPAGAAPSTPAGAAPSNPVVSRCPLEPTR